MSGGTRNRPPLSPKEAWLSDGRQVLHFRPTLWERTDQRLELISRKLANDPDLRLRHSVRISADGGGARR